MNFLYTKEQGTKLLELARKSIESEFTKQAITLPDAKEFKQARGVFVTLTKDNELRGCIGFPYPEQSISQGILDASKSAAFEDPRFPKLKESELKNIRIEISILTQPQQIKDIKEIVLGKDGLMCNYLGFSGLLLPQVATEHKLSKIQFLEALCSKAGLPRDTWQSKAFKIYKFQAQIFNE